MEIKYQWVLFICFAIIVFFLIQYFTTNNKKHDFNGGKKVVGTYYAKETLYLKKRIRQYKICKVLLVIVSIFCVCVSSLILSKPYKTELIEKNSYNRDIILCIDVSFSVIQLDFKIIRELKHVVNNLRGDRFGIVIFNASPVLVTPLTDDYEYIIQQLDLIEKGLYVNLDDEMIAEMTNDGMDFDSLEKIKDEWFDYNGYVSAGTLTGAEERGSSLIGDGLAASVYDFQESEQERNKLIIFSTDNDVQGDPIVTLSEAADICVENNVKVYGIGTSDMTNQNMTDMKKAMEKTGGKFYLEEEMGTVDEIVKNIEKETKSLLKDEKEIKENEIVFVPFLLLIIGVSCMLILKKITKGR